ncbi:MAG: hypothetical protein ACLS3M_06700 [Collinsella sp.]
MGLIQKKDEKDEIDGIQIIERGEGPDGEGTRRSTGRRHVCEHIAPARPPRRRTPAWRLRLPRMPLTRTSCPRSRTRTTPTWTTMHQSTRRR